MREIVEDLVDFDALRHQPQFKLFIAATEVRNGKIKLFRESELTTEHVLASACLPSIHHAIEIDNKFYWDGGFSGNPAVFPLIYDCKQDDTLVILLQALQHEELPKKAEDIKDRVTEISFHSTFLREMKAIMQLKRMISKPSLFLNKTDKKIKHFRTHLIEDQALMGNLYSSSKYNTRISFLNCLREAGQQSAEDWLVENSQHIGKKDSCDIYSLFE